MNIGKKLFSAKDILGFL